ncbi:MAG: SDR family oxidoreductase [Microbacteriaceae bacterium]|nr:MAG: SDR family oxidoreductase [Microbacteriaceae bacterium]
MTRGTAVVTGAHGGLGAAISRALVDDGYRVAVLDRDQELADAAADALAAPDRVRGFAADQESAEAVELAFAAVRDWSGAPDVTVANAGYAKFGALLDMPARTWNRHVAINLSGTFFTVQAAARAMVADRRSGAIVVVSSSLARAHSDQVGAYSTTKAALLPMVRSFAAELGVYGIRVNAVLPGVIETPMTSPMLDEGATRQSLLNLTPAGRLGRPADVVEAIRFLTGEASSWVTGTALDVDGGQSIYGEPRWIVQDRTVPGEPAWVPNHATNKEK